MKPFLQIAYLWRELKLMNNSRPWRWFTCWFSTPLAVIAFYRLDRCCYLLFGRLWPILRVPLTPFLFLIRPWTGGAEIHYQADIGPGLRVLHPTLGVIVSAKTVAGENLVLTGGNCIGGRKALEHGDIRIGNNVSLGANATVLGPVQVGDGVKIGAGAVVVKDVADSQTVVGVPASAITTSLT